MAAGFGAYASEGSDLAVCEPAMTAIELLQTYLLIHDDWMDDDDVRRGGPSVHVQLRGRFGSRPLGDAGAVLAGDLASGYAQDALLETDLPAPRVLAAARVFARIQVEVVQGQLAEMTAARAAAGPVPNVEAIHALKTASYTVRRPLLFGLAPLLVDEANSNDQRIVVGPITQLSEATALCARLERLSVSCLPMPFTGTPLAY